MRQAIWAGLIVAGLVGPAVAMAAVVLDASKVSTPPTAAVLNYTARSAGNIPSGGLDLDLKCTKSASGGGQCLSPRTKVSPETLRAAWSRFSMTGYDMAGQSAFGPWDVALHFDPKDVLTLDPPAALTRATPKTVVNGYYVGGARAPMDRFYPELAMRLGKEGVVVLACQVQPDLSMACVTTRETPTGVNFAAFAMQETLLLKAAPTMPDGTPAPGQWLSHTVEFHIP